MFYEGQRMDQDQKEYQSQAFTQGNEVEPRANVPKPSRTTDEIQAWLISRLAEQLEIGPEEINVQEPFTSYGLSSREAIVLSGELEEWLSHRLSPTLLYE